MIRRHPVLCVVAAFYLIALVAVTVRQESLVATGSRALTRLAPWADGDIVEFVVNVMTFVPMGLLFVLIAGRRRWWGVLVLGILLAFWVQLAEIVWLPRPNSSMILVFAHAVGVVIGVVVALVISGAIHRRERRAVAAQR